MKLWIDSARPAPEGYVWCKSIDETKHRIRRSCEELIVANIYNNKDIINYFTIEFISICFDNIDYIRLLDWLEETGRNYPIHIHSQNAVGVANMRRIIERNGWKEIR